MKKYQEIKKGYLEKYKLLKNATYLKGETIDGYEIRIFANLENPKEIDALIKTGATGVGLFRSEYLFLSRKRFPTEDEQFEIYKRMAKALRGRPLVVRVFDVGGDKKADLALSDEDSKYFLEIGKELNPALGCRAIRVLLRYPALLENQLRAILRASVHGCIQMMYPMISGIGELRQANIILNQVKTALRDEKVPFDEQLKVGVMIEVPAAVMTAEQGS